MPWWRKSTEAELEAERLAAEEWLSEQEKAEAEHAEKARVRIREVFAENSANGERFVDIRWNQEGFGEEMCSLWDFVDFVVELANEKKDVVEHVEFYNMDAVWPHTRGAILTMRRPV